MSEILNDSLEMNKASLTEFITQKINEFQATGSAQQEVLELGGFLAELNGSCSQERVGQINERVLEISRSLGVADSVM